jgi:alkyl sulfatase BDS1-like metallo-beta-lactamase superfamily hydrolase
MVEYFSEPYFQEIASLLNADADFQAKAQKLTTQLLFIAPDKDRAFIMRVSDGKVQAASATAETDAEFKFTAPYDTWIRNHRDGDTLEKLIMTGKVRFKGAIPRILSLKGQLGAVDQKARSITVTY